MEVADHDLVRQMAHGDTQALAAFYDRHAPRTLGFLLRLVGDRGEAEDLLQVTFHEVWSRAGQYDPRRAGPVSWLLMIARSRALDHSRKRSFGVGLQEAPEPVAIEEVSRGLERREESRKVHLALERLPAEQRQALLLAFFCGQTHEQIAGHLTLPLGTVKSRIRMGMHRLRELIGEP